jgi:hypothetical protein
MQCKDQYNISFILTNMNHEMVLGEGTLLDEEGGLK